MKKTIDEVLDNIEEELSRPVIGAPSIHSMHQRVKSDYNDPCEDESEYEGDYYDECENEDEEVPFFENPITALFYARGILPIEHVSLGIPVAHFIKPEPLPNIFKEVRKRLENELEQEQEVTSELLEIPKQKNYGCR